MVRTTVLVLLLSVVAVGAALLPGAGPAAATGVTADTLIGDAALGSDTTRGDVDGSGEVNSIDALLILQFDAAIIDPPPNPEKWYQNGDLNEDGLLDSLDATLILQFHAGLIDSL
ncbi:MAG: hypothetical protein IIC89_02675 [Chloroflexi bacterium]|nr:hypothetical protein [Chloroflexota bacterium]